MARTQLLRNRWLRWYLLAETCHFLASKLTRWGQARTVKAPRMQSAERLSLWRACLTLTRTLAPNPTPTPQPYP